MTVFFGIQPDCSIKFVDDAICYLNDYFVFQSNGFNIQAITAVSLVTGTRE